MYLGPRSISVIGCGPTSQTWNAGNFTYERQVPKTEEVWTLNKGLRTIRADRGFVLDDMVGEARRCPEYADDLNRLQIPLITSTVDVEVRKLFPDLDLIRYPMKEIIWEIGVRFGLAQGYSACDLLQPEAMANIQRVGYGVGYYLHNSGPMILAYAMWLGVKQINLYGMDYTFPGQDMREDDRANMEYWVGFLRGQGIEVKVTTDTTLLNSRKQPFLYGYGARPPVLSLPERLDIEIILDKLGKIS